MTVQKKQSRFGLDNELVITVQNIFAQNAHLDKAIIFGSRAIGNYKNGSDIDIALVGENLKLDDILTVKSQLNELPYAYTYDLVNYTKLNNPAVKAHIDDLGIVFYEKPRSVLVKGWKKYKLGDITTWRSGGTPSKNNEDYWNGDIPWISAKTFPSKKASDSPIKISEQGLKTGSRLAKVDSILLLVRGSGLFNDIPIAIVTQPVAFNQDIKSIEINNSVIQPIFLLYWLKGNKKLLNDVLEYTGIGAGKFDVDVLKEITISVPPLKIQTEIASILSALDDKIELNLRMNQTLEAIAQALFTEWFVNFKFPGFDGELIDGLPRGWRRGNLGNLLQLNYGKALRSDNRQSGPFPVIGSSGIVGYHNEFLVKGPGIVIGRKGTIGEVIWLKDNFYPIDTTYYIEDAVGIDDLYFHYYVLKLQDFERIASDSAVPGLNRNEALRNSAIVPSLVVINQFSQALQPIFAKKSMLDAENQTLTQLRDSLLPKLMSGQLTVAADG